MYFHYTIIKHQIKEEGNTVILLTPYPIIIKLGWFTLYSHGLFFGLGAILTAITFSAFARRWERVPRNVYWDLVVIFASSLIISRLGYFLVYPQDFQNLGQLVSIWKGGLVSYFGLVAGFLLAIKIFRAYPGNNWKRWLDLFVVAALPGWAIGRIGNFLAGDSYGLVSESWRFFYQRVPIQLLETAWCLLLFALFYGRLRLARTYRGGSVAGWVVISYLLGRFVIDYWRDEPEILGWQLSQIASLLLAGVFAVYLSLLKRYDEHA